MNPLELLKKAADVRSCSLRVRICKIDNDKQLATGEVYAPLVVDSHGDMIEEDELVQLAHAFVANKLVDQIDLMHNNEKVQATAVESFISRGHPDFTEGAWVVTLKIDDPALWEDIKSGVYNGFSMEVLTNKVPAIVTMTIQPQVFGNTEECNGPDHAFYLMVNDDGRVCGGRTSYDGGHSHTIRSGTATEETDGHQHRYFLS